MHKSEIVSRQVPAPGLQHLSYFDQGTRVTVRNLFGNMPVRVKQRAINSEKQGAMGKEWESLKSNLVLLLLAWPKKVALSLRSLSTNQKMIIRGPSEHGPDTDIHRVCRMLSQSSLITHDERDSWVPVGASTSSLKVSGTISLIPSPTKAVQFLSFDIQPLVALEGQSILHDEINRLFLNSAFGNEEESEELDEAEVSQRAKDGRYKGDGYTNKELKGGKKGVDRWPMFYINIQRANSLTFSKELDIDDILDDKVNSLKVVIDLLQAMIFEFLTRHHFRPKAPRGDRSKNTQGGQGDIPVVEDRPPAQQDQRIVTFAKSPSVKGSTSRPARVEKGKPAKIRNTDSDLLGATVKLPSFRRASSTSESPFDGWSRIKIGAPKPILDKAGERSTAQEIQRPATAPLPAVSQVVRPMAPRPSTPLVSMTGKVIRRPFEDIQAPSTSSKSTPVRPLPASTSQSKPVTPQPKSAVIDLTQDDANDIVAWINPITKVKSIINKRTGHTVPVVDTNTSRSSTQSLISPSPSSRLKLSNSHSNFNPSEPSPWLTSVLEKWENPVFRPAEPCIPQVSVAGETDGILHGHRQNCSQLDISRAFTEASPGIVGRISKAALKNAEVIGQVDRKFILVKLPTSEKGQELGKILVIIDQHAADERIRVEGLLAELCTLPPPRLDRMPIESGVVTTYLEKGLAFEVSDKDIEFLRTRRAYFADWGILYDFPATAKASTTNNIRIENKAKQRFTVRALPPGIAERCKSDPKILIELIRAELYSSAKSSSANSTSTLDPGIKHWLTKIHNCPQGILDMINSRACRSAIMFNDVLSKEQCEFLVARLAETAFPFQCAHGRPSLLPLVELGSVPHNQAYIDEHIEGQGFGRGLRKWKAGMQK